MGLKCTMLMRDKEPQSFVYMGNQLGAIFTESLFHLYPVIIGLLSLITWGLEKSEDSKSPLHSENTRDQFNEPYRKFKTHKITFVIQDWGGSIGVAYALETRTCVSRLIFINTVTGYGGGPTNSCFFLVSICKRTL